MEEGNEKLNGSEFHEREEIHSKSVRAGKRTYFFDVKSTKKNDYYLTITESKKRLNKDGNFFYEKHKIFLYKEDFEKFTEGLNEIVEFITTANPLIIAHNDRQNEDINEEYVSVDFEDLETK